MAGVVREIYVNKIPENKTSEMRGVSVSSMYPPNPTERWEVKVASVAGYAITRTE